MSSMCYHNIVDTTATHAGKYTAASATHFTCACLAEVAARKEAKAQRNREWEAANPEGKRQLGLSCQTCAATARLTPLQLTPADTQQHKLLTLLVHALQRLLPGRRPRHRETESGRPQILRVSVSWGCHVKHVLPQQG